MHNAGLSGKPLRPGGSPGHPEGGLWVPRCCCRRVPGSFSSGYSCVARLCTCRSAWQLWARLVQSADAGLKRSTVATNAALPICLSLIAKSSSNCKCAGFAVERKAARGGPRFCRLTPRSPGRGVWCSTRRSAERCRVSSERVSWFEESVGLTVSSQLV